MIHVKDELKKKISDKVSSCIFWLIAIIIATVATFIWQTKIALFILSITVIFFILSLIELCLVCLKLKKILSDEKRKEQEKADKIFARQEPEKNLYEVLHSLRNEHSERLCDMAKKIGVKTGDLYRIENGLEKNRIKVKEVLTKIEKVYNLGGIEIATLQFGFLTTYGEKSKDAN
ncbi:MAG: hypothetical protein [Caudoviricetes sp.]|nr:MAG: hypothetical protein [Caudoviricetes sp.]